MNKSQLFVLPSLQDGCSIAVSQALKTGLPVIVSENTGNESIIKKNNCGYVVPVRNSNILYDKIDHLIENPNQLKLFSTNAINFSNNNSWTDYVDKLNQIINNFN